MSDTRAVSVEIIENRRKPDDGSFAASIVVPNEVRVNGQKVMVPGDHPVKVHDLTSDGAVLVTLTLFARRIFVGTEHVDETVLNDVDAATKALLDAQQTAVAAQLAANDAISQAQAQLAEANRRLAVATQ